MWQLDQAIPFVSGVMHSKTDIRSTTQTALKDLGLCQQGTKPHFEIFSAAVKQMMS